MTSLRQMRTSSTWSYFRFTARLVRKHTPYEFSCSRLRDIEKHTEESYTIEYRGGVRHV